MHILGIDLAKKTFDVTLLTPTEARYHHTFPNTPAGFRALWRWVKEGHRAARLYGSDKYVLGSHRAVSVRAGCHGACGQPGAHQRLCPKPDAAQQDRQTG